MPAKQRGKHSRSQLPKLAGDEDLVRQIVRLESGLLGYISSDGSPQALSMISDNEWNFYDQSVVESRVTINAINVSLNSEIITSNANISVFADTIKISGTVQFPGRLVFLHARRIICDGAFIDVTGADCAKAFNFVEGDKAVKENQKAGEDGEQGKDGGAGGSGGGVAILAESIEGTLEIRANGGRGGRGQDGGDGAQGDTGASHTAMYERGETGKQGGSQGRGGNGGAGGFAGWISINTVTPIPVGKIVVISKAGIPGPPGSNGKPGPGGNGGASGDTQDVIEVGCKRNSVADRCFITKNRRSQPPGPTGPTGSLLLSQDWGWAFQPRAGLSNLDAQLPQPRKIDYKTLGAYASMYQILMQLNAASLRYLSDEHQEAWTHLQWLESITRNTPGSNIPPKGSDNDTLVTDTAQWNKVLQSRLFSGQLNRPSTNYVPPPDKFWLAVRKEILSLIAQMEDGLDFYGRPPGYVPLVSYGFYRSAMDSMLPLAKDIEKSYKGYRNALRLKERDTDALDLTISKSKVSIIALTSAVNKLATEAQEHQAIVNSMLESILRQKNILAVGEQQFRDAVERKVREQKGNCDFPETLNIIMTVAAVAGPAYGSATTLMALVGGKMDDGIRAELKKQQSKEPFILRKIEKAGAEVKNLVDAYSKIRSELKNNTDDSAKIMVDERNFEETLRPFLTMPEAQAYRDQLRAFLETVKARNQKILELNAIIHKRAIYEAQIDQLDQQIATISNLRQASTDIGLVEYKAFMQAVYSRTKMILIRTLYEERRAWEYWALRQIPFDVQNQDVSALEFIHLDIIGTEIEERKARRRVDQLIEGVTLTISSTEKTAGKKTADFYMPSAFEGFKNSRSADFGKLVFSITPNHPAFEYEDRVAITAKQVMVHIPGIQTANDQVKIRLIHSGHSTFVDTERKQVKFNHEPRATDIDYSISGAGSRHTVTENNLGGSKGEYIFLSPFTTWSLSIDPKANVGLDLSMVTEIRIVFDLYFLPLTSRPA